MAKKASHHGHSPTPLKPRVQRAISEGKFQQALDLAKQLHKQEPTPAHLELVKTAYLGRGKQLREQGYGRDAITTLEAALRIDSTPAWLEQIARELALAGGIPQALALIEQLPPDAASIPLIRGHAADAALLQENAGREQLPPALQPDYDRVCLAFQQVEQGQDEQAKATMQEIGLRSPFLEWKVLLRGFQAYYQKDDTRALENWQRLTPERLPARVAAPFRCQIDSAYRAAQPPPTQNAMSAMLDRAQGSTLPQELRGLQKVMQHDDTLAAAFRKAEALLPHLKQQAPDLVPRLANTFYWAATESGPEDVPRYLRVFGTPPLDPHLTRLHALAYDRVHDVVRAHPQWQAYEKEIANHPELFPEGQAARARALIWMHMGKNAATIPSKKKMAKLPRFLRDHPEVPKNLDPSPDQCFEKAIELAPDQVEAHEELFRYYLGEDNRSKAAKAAKQLLERFPNHGPTLQAFGQLRMREKKYKDALQLFQRALESQPLDREVRNQLASAHTFQARVELDADKVEAARQHYEQALGLYDESMKSTILGRLAACAFRAGEMERAEELLNQAIAREVHPLVMSFLMLTEAIRQKWPKALKTRFEKEYKAGLAAPAVPEAAAKLLHTMASLKELEINYAGMKAHETAILKYANKGQKANWDARQIEAVVRALFRLFAVAPARRFLTAARRRFRNDPVFPFLEAVSYFVEGRPERMPVFPVRFMLEEAERLAEALPPDEARTKLLEDIHHHQGILDALSPFGGMPPIFESFFGEYDDEFDDDDDPW